MSDLGLAPLRRALLSVSDKTGLVPLGQALAAAGVDLISTGGTARALRDAGLSVRDVSEVTGFPEMMDGRVKTLHPGVHGGLLARRDLPAHLDALEAHGIAQIDLAVINLYPFAQTVAAGGSDAQCVENIDIGGPAMIRAAAKNHEGVTVVVDPARYEALIAELTTHRGATSLAFRKLCAAQAYGHTAAYDAAVASWMADYAGERTPQQITLAGTLAQTLRYGENPHQAARFYTTTPARPGIATARQHQGKALSYNNINDADAAFELVSEFPSAQGPAVAIIKHANPCGVATADTLEDAYRAAFDCDRVSAFGGIVALNQPLNGPTATAIAEIFTEVVIAPDADEAARAVFAQKPNLRLLTTGSLADPQDTAPVVRQVAGGLLVQDRDGAALDAAKMTVVSARQPSAEELADMRFAWVVAKHVKSNAIVYAKNRATVGIGAGQMSRVDSTRIAARKAQDMAQALGLEALPTEGSVVASDAFFPFADGVLTAAQAGATALIQPGGSMRDAEVIEAANTAGLAMIFTGQRHFRH
ncbi:MAG: bifunctional phosphoribosylaminoimidazolecarboxamide formyltransferase/IMP cyclohydrolase [Pseudomonadota bacterium]